jgi:hypothetical protein
MAAARNTDRWRYGAMLLAGLLLATTLTTVTACERMDCGNIATTGCAGSTLYDVYTRPGRD